jgi:hypothetical protein
LEGRPTYNIRNIIFPQLSWIVSIPCLQDISWSEKNNMTIYREENHIIYWIQIWALQEEHHPHITDINIVFTTSLSSYKIIKHVEMWSRLSSNNNRIVPPSIQLVTHIIIHLSFESTEKSQIVNTTVDETSHDASQGESKKVTYKGWRPCNFYFFYVNKGWKFPFHTNSSILTSAAMTCTIQNLFGYFSTIKFIFWITAYNCSKSNVLISAW